MNRFKAFSVADIRKMVEKADKTAKKDADNNVGIVYKKNSIDDQLGGADRVKVIEREVK